MESVQYVPLFSKNNCKYTSCYCEENLKTKKFMKNIPIWVCKMILIIIGLFYWGVPQWIKKQSSEEENLRTKTTYIGFHFVSTVEKNLFVIQAKLDSVLRKEVDSVDQNHIKLTPEIYFELLWRNRARYSEYNIAEGNSMVVNDLESKARDVMMTCSRTQIDSARALAQDKYELNWREKDAKSKKETDEWIQKTFPNIFYKIYWTNIVFAIFWFLLTFASKKRKWREWSLHKKEGPIPVFNPLSLIISSIIWPYFFVRSISRGYKEGKAHVEIRRTKINPFSLLSKDERALVKKFASSIKVERVEILKEIRSSGIRHSFGLALIATIVISITPMHIFAKSIDHSHVSISKDVSHAIHHNWGDHEETQMREMVECKVPLPIQKIIKQYFYFYQRIVKGVRVHIDHIPWTCVYIICSKHLVKHIKKNPKYEKNKNVSGAHCSINYC